MRHRLLLTACDTDALVAYGLAAWEYQDVGGLLGHPATYRRGALARAGRAHIRLLPCVLLACRAPDRTCSWAPAPRGHGPCPTHDAPPPPPRRISRGHQIIKLQLSPASGRIAALWIKHQLTEEEKEQVGRGCWPGAAGVLRAGLAWPGLGWPGPASWQQGGMEAPASGGCSAWRAGPRAALAAPLGVPACLCRCSRTRSTATPRRCPPTTCWGWTACL